jgi:hypothetical protein
MTKYTLDTIPMIPKLIKFEKRQIKETMDIHWNFSEFVRDAVDEKIIREQAILESMKK